MSIPTSDFDFYSDAVIADPFPVYAKLRDLGPVVYLHKNDLYIVARFKEVSEVLLQPLRFVSSRGVSPIQKVNDILVGSTLNSDPPIHDKTRAITAEPLLPGSLVEVEPRIKAAADGLIETLCTRGEFDAVSDLAQFLPITIVAELVGLPQAVGSEQMLRWASATFNLFGTENSRTDQAFEDLKTLRDFLQDYGRPEMLAQDGWAKRIFDVGPERGFSYEACAQLMRDYINPSLDTTISATGQIIKFCADEPQQWDKIREDARLIPNAIEEAVRLATPIRAFTRYVIEDTEVSGQVIPEGSRVIVCYASANRDPRKYADPDKFDVTRDVHDHMGFGRGVHMCMGMHLARREIILLMEALRRRVSRFTLAGAPVVAMNNTIRAFSSLPVKVDLSNLNDVEKQDTTASAGGKWLLAQIVSRREVATDIIGLEIANAEGATLPAYDAGAHIDVEIRSGLVRQYSLAGDPEDKSRYRLGILKDTASRGGSEEIHSEFKPGKLVRIGVPRNSFPLVDAAHTILFAGGIGITPILSMAHKLERIGASWEMHYSGRSYDRLAFREELTRFGERVHFYLDDGSYQQKLDVQNTLSEPSNDKHLYVCGPHGYMDFITNAAKDAGWPSDSIHLERFGAEIDTNGAPFVVVAKRSGKEIEILPGETIADKLTSCGIKVAVSCQSGVCGTCMTKVLGGSPDHRDLVLTDLEKAAGDQMTICCSRSKTKRLILEI